MTPAEKRVKELIDRWLTSLDLHLQYVELKDSAYNNVQPWPVHDRPTRWILELAKQKALEMQAAFESRLAMGDSKFADTVELMVFLSTLVGIQHVQRYIPLADPDRHGQSTLTESDGLKPVVKGTPTLAMPVAIPARAPAAASTASAATTVSTAIMPPRAPLSKAAPPVQPTAKSSAEDDSTREMPRPNRAPDRSPVIPAKKPQVASPPPSKSAPAKASTPAKPAAATIEAESDAHSLVINDAVRLLNWGRPWHELAELIARIADRPKLPEVRRILRSHRATIEMRAADAQPEEKKG